METFSRETSRGLNPWYVTGFVDGEGSFTYSRSGRNIVLYFAIKLAAQDRGVLDAIRAYFGGIGKMYSVKARLPKGRGAATKAAWYFRVSQIRELEHIVAHFDRYPLRGIKIESYRVWRKMLRLKQQFRKVDRESLELLSQKLTSLSPRHQV